MIFGPIADAVNEKLATDLPNDFIIASRWRRRRFSFPGVNIQTHTCV